MITDAGDADFSEPGIDGLALEREHAEDALMDAAQRLAADEALERLDAESELADCERALAAEAAGAQALEVDAGASPTRAQARLARPPRS